MELALLVYLLGLLAPLSGVLFATTLLLGIVVIMSGLYKLVEDSDYKISKTLIAVFILSGTISVAIPSEKTAYLMVGAYATQKVAETPEAKEIGIKVLKIVNEKLDKLAK